MKKLFNLQMFADDPTASSTAADSSAPGTAEKADGVKAAADTGKEESAKPEKKYSDDDVDRIVKSRLAREREQAKKEKEEAEKLAEMNATQKAEYKLAEAEKRIAEFERKESISEMTKVARKMLSEKNITISDELLGMMVTTDAKETKSAVDGFAKAFTDAVEAAVKERLKGEPPRRGSGASAAMTKEQIMAIKDPELRQKKMLENRHLYKF